MPPAQQRSEAEAALLRSRMGAAKEVSKIRSDSATSAKELAAAFDAKLAAMREALGTQATVEAKAAEEAKNTHIQVRFAGSGVGGLNRASCI